MNRRDHLLQAATAAALEVITRRSGLSALEAAIARLSVRQRELLTDEFLDDLRHEANARRVADSTPTMEIDQ